MIDYSQYTDREIDALVAERVMGWHKGIISYFLVWASKYNELKRVDFNPTNNWNDMQLIVERMEKLGFDTIHFWRSPLIEKWGAKFEINGDDAATAVYANTLPRAVCEAALSATEATDD